jgi:hypothetical protein
MVKRVFQSAGQQLGFKVHGKEARAGVNLLAAGHDFLPFADPYCLQMVCLTGRLREVFLQLRWASQTRAFTAHVPINSSVLV